MLTALARLQLKQAAICRNGLKRTWLPCNSAARAACTPSLQRAAAAWSLCLKQQPRPFSSTTIWFASRQNSLQKSTHGEKEQKDRRADRKTGNTFAERIRTYLQPLLDNAYFAYLARVLKISLTVFVVYHLSTYIVLFRGTWGPSMIPTFSFDSEIAIISVFFHRRGRNIAVGDLISFENPVRPGWRSIKRVIGMPGDIVCRDTPGKGEGWLVQVPEGHCWVTGDNLDASRDSRVLGPIPLALVRGKVIGKISRSSPPRVFKNGLVDAEDAEEWLALMGQEEDEEEKGLVAAIKNQLVRNA